jgi:branched-chain amino acid transport system ATP-binding protein
MTAPAPLILQGVYKAFDRSQILRGVDLQLQPGERCALIGPNGPASPVSFTSSRAAIVPMPAGCCCMGDITHAPPQQIHRLGWRAASRSPACSRA